MNQDIQYLGVYSANLGYLFQHGLPNDYSFQDNTKSLQFYLLSISVSIIEENLENLQQSMQGIMELQNQAITKNKQVYQFYQDYKNTRNQNPRIEYQQSIQIINKIYYIFNINKIEIIDQLFKKYINHNYVKQQNQYTKQNKNKRENIKQQIDNNINQRNQNIINTQVINDTQNVHDSNVVKQLNQIYKKNVNPNPSNQQCDQTDISEFENLRQQIIGFYNSNQSENKQEDRYKKINLVLDNIQKYGKTPMSYVNDQTQQQIIYQIWDNIKNDSKKKNLLIQNMCESIQEDGKSLYCQAGIAARLMDTLQDFENPIKPTWAIKQQLTQRAGVIYQQIIDQLNEQELNEFNNSTSNGQVIENRIKDQTKQQIYRENENGDSNVKQQVEFVQQFIDNI